MLSVIGKSILGEIERHCRATGFSAMKCDIFIRELDKSWTAAADTGESRQLHRALDHACELVEELSGGKGICALDKTIDEKGCNGHCAAHYKETLLKEKE